MPTPSPLSSSQTSLIVPPEHYYVGFWVRLGAAFIDVIILFVVPFTLSFVATEPISSTSGQLSLSSMDLIIYVGFPGMAAIWFWQRLHATPGKLLMGAQIVDADSGKPTTWRQAIIRYLGYSVSLLLLGLGMFWVGFDRRKQGWHDKMANTVVVRSSRKSVRW